MRDRYASVEKLMQNVLADLWDADKTSDLKLTDDEEDSLRALKHDCVAFLDRYETLQKHEADFIDKPSF